MAHDPRVAPLSAALLRDQLDRLERRLDKLESPKEGPGSSWSRIVKAVDKICAWLPAITPIVLFFLGKWFVDAAGEALDNQKAALENQRLALQARQVDLGGIGQMRELIAELYQDGITPSQAQAIALSLAAFGDLAAPPLIHAIETGSPNRRTGAEAGLAAAALAAPDKVCATLAQVVDNRTALFTWQTHESAIRLLGQLGCRNQRLSLEAFGRLLDGGVAAYRPTVHEDGVPEVDDVIVRRLLDEQRQAVQRIAAAQPAEGTGE